MNVVELSGVRITSKHLISIELSIYRVGLADAHQRDLR